MIHYTPLPLEHVFFDPAQYTNSFREILVDGVPVTVQLNSDTEATIVRVTSMDPMHYLDPRFQPGNRLQFFSFVSKEQMDINNNFNQSGFM